MAEIWEELLNVDELGVSANFFKLGGDSIKALQVCARLKQRGFETTVREMFEHQTLGELSAGFEKTYAPLTKARSKARLLGHLSSSGFSRNLWKAIILTNPL